MSTVPTQAPAGAADHALRVLYRDHATALLRYAQWFTDDPAAAEDAVQETFLRAWRHLPRLHYALRAVRSRLDAPGALRPV